MAMGGLIIPTSNVVATNARIAELRLPELPNGEMKVSDASATP